MEDYKKLTQNLDFKDKAFLHLANTQFILLNYSEAIENYTKSITYHKEDAIAYLNRGNAKFKIRDYSGSINDYTKSLDLNGKSYIALNN